MFSGLLASIRYSGKGSGSAGMSKSGWVSMEHHEAEQRPTKPFSYRSLLHLYKGSNTDILFQQYAKAFSNNQSKEILSKLRKLDLQDVPNGFEFMGKVFRWMEQGLLIQVLLTVGE